MNFSENWRHLYSFTQSVISHSGLMRDELYGTSLMFPSMLKNDSTARRACLGRSSVGQQ